MDEPIQRNAPIIKHIVITGGDVVIMNAFGALQEAHRQGIWNYETVESFYGTSSGSVLSLMLALGYPLETIEKYLIGRPWYILFGLQTVNYYDCIVGNGIHDSSFFYKVFIPLFQAKDIDINITFRELYELLGKELYFYTINLKTAESEELSHKTRPNMRVLDGISASGALPILCKPFKYEGTFYTDGGFYSNYPIAKCLGHGHSEENILGVRIKELPVEITENMGLFEYLLCLIAIILTYTQDKVRVQKNDIFFDATYSISQKMAILEKPEERIKAVENGAEDARRWLRQLQDADRERQLQDADRERRLEERRQEERQLVDKEQSVQSVQSAPSAP